VIAGQVENRIGPVTGIAIDPLYLDVTLTPGGLYRHAIPADHTPFVYLYEGAASFAEEKRSEASRLITFGDGEEVVVGAESGARFLLLAARPIGEPVARYGPFVMNSREEIEAAIDDYRSGRFITPTP